MGRVFVKNQDGTPLSPCHPARARILLKQGKARVYSVLPFTIQLTYRIEEDKGAPLRVGIDDGAQEVGWAVVQPRTKKPDAVVIAGVIEQRRDIKERMDTRRHHRRARRNRKAYRQPRFDNRRREEGWLPPTIRGKKDAILRVTQDIANRGRVDEVVVEDVQIDTQKLMNPNIKGVQYQGGFSKDYYNLREAVLYRDNHSCRICDEKSVRLEVHHIQPRESGGTDRAENLITLCQPCHEAVHHGTTVIFNDPDFEGKLPDLKAPAHVMQGKNYLRRRLAEVARVSSIYGYETKYYRHRYNWEKSHINDAIALVQKGRPVTKAQGMMIIRPLQRHVRKRWETERRRNAAVVQQRVGKRLLRKVLAAGAEVPAGCEKHIRHGDLVHVVKSGKAYTGWVYSIKTRRNKSATGRWPSN
ncbi:MAG TPA: HNH endonuclease [Firmicutes bacterium]|nr:HNH endonuclease [Bacillota bacterium]